MPRPDKVAVVDDVRDGLTQSAATLLTHYRGLSVTDVAELREKLRDSNARMRVAKNTLSRRAAQDAGIDGLADMLSGPTGLVFCEDDPVGPAKVLRDFAKDHPELVIRGGYFDGEILDEVAATKLADLESREDLLAKLAGLMYGALANTARLLNAATEKQARLMQALVDAGGVEAKGFSPEPAAAAAADEAPAAEASADEDAPAEPAADAESEPAEASAEAAPEDDAESATDEA